MRNLYLEKKTPCSNRYPPNFSKTQAGKPQCLSGDGQPRKTKNFGTTTCEPKVYEWLLKRFIANRIQ